MHFRDTSLHHHLLTIRKSAHCVDHKVSFSMLTDDSCLGRDRLGALLSQEKNYCCPDYLDPSYARTEPDLPPKPTPLRIIQECAKLISDLSLESPPTFDRAHSPSSTAFTATFVKPATHSKFPQQETVTHKCLVTWRREMSQWAYRAVDTFGLDRELVAVAFDMLDRYLSREIKSDFQDFERQDFQLYSMTCLFIAVKILEPTQKLSIPALIDMSRGYYCAEDITETEMEILEVLQWQINPPTPQSFIQELADVMPPVFTKGVLDTCQELTELSVMDEFFVPYKASTIAVAVILSAARQHKLTTEELKTQVQQWINFDEKDVSRLCQHFER